MLEYNRTDTSEGININKTSDLHEFRGFNYCCFFKINFSYQLLADNRFHDLLQIQQCVKENNNPLSPLYVGGYVITKFMKNMVESFSNDDDNDDVEADDDEQDSLIGFR